MVLHEICRPPHGAPVRRAQLNEILKYWLEKFEHPMAIVIGEVASKMIQHHDIPIEDAIRRMHDLSAYPGLYAALGILNFVCDDSAGELEKVYAEIVKGWEAQIDPSQPPSRPPPPQIEC
jgi:hypothetical protein